LTAEDLDALDKCLRLVRILRGQLLIYSFEEFAWFNILLFLIGLLAGSLGRRFC